MSPSTSRTVDILAVSTSLASSSLQQGLPGSAGQNHSQSVNMLASCSDDGSFARKYELSYGRSRSKRLGERRQGLHDPAEPPSWSCADEAHRRQPHPSHRHGARRRPAEVAALISVDNLDVLKAQRARGSTSGARDLGWTAPRDAFLVLMRRKPENAPVEGIYAARCMDPLSYIPR